MANFSKSTMNVQISFDDGETWQRLETSSDLHVDVQSKQDEPIEGLTERSFTAYCKVRIHPIYRMDIEQYFTGGFHPFN